VNYSCRRIVTGVNANGASCVISDGVVSDAFGLPGVLDVIELWQTTKDENSIPIRQLVPDRGRHELLPAPGGTKFLLEVAWPEKMGFGAANAKEMFEALRIESGVSGSLKSLHPGMHKSDTIDYVVILSGEIHLILECEEVLVRTGDVIVQGGVPHSWSNRSSQPCVLLAVVVGVGGTDITQNHSQGGTP